METLNAVAMSRVPQPNYRFANGNRNVINLAVTGKPRRLLRFVAIRRLEGGEARPVVLLQAHQMGTVSHLIINQNHV